MRFACRLCLVWAIISLIGANLSGAWRIKKADCNVANAKSLLIDEFWDNKERAREFTGEVFKTRRKYHNSRANVKSHFLALLYLLQSCEAGKFEAATAQFDELTMNQGDKDSIPSSHLVQAANAAIEASADCTMAIYNILNKSTIDTLLNVKVNKIIEWVLLFREAIELYGCERNSVSGFLSSGGNVTRFSG